MTRSKGPPQLTIFWKCHCRMNNFLFYFRFMHLWKKFDIQPNPVGWMRETFFYFYLYNMINFNCYFLLFWAKAAIFKYVFFHSIIVRNDLNCAPWFIILHYIYILVNCTFIKTEIIPLFPSVNLVKQFSILTINSLSKKKKKILRKTTKD